MKIASSKLLISILLICFSCTFHYLYSQENDTLKQYNNSIYPEIGGNASFISINYERVLVSFNKTKLNSRIGIGLGIYWRVPLMLSASWRTGDKSLMEIGAGISLAYDYNNNTNKLFQDPMGNGIIALIAVKFQKPKQNVFTRIGWTPTYLYNDFYGQAVLYLLQFGISAGICF